MGFVDNVDARTRQAAQKHRAGQGTKRARGRCSAALEALLQSSVRRRQISGNSTTSNILRR